MTGTQVKAATTQLYYRDPTVKSATPSYFLALFVLFTQASKRGDKFMIRGNFASILTLLSALAY